ncbi:OLC1v1005572C1 [Oldenlandia corymbosa var. corymbosa]|uniref:OLC1v1005572C1 n=1 Tax=Oldenlandia corymbosa var. corymbosa TaxID=529605 RepID=A0AAV1DHD1_OLDCO|nr:OLC1v1005572C1 [Oldenlandia corymbosa var. corymbosa]
MGPEPSSNFQFPIKTIVVLVQENRSFDHMLGWMKTLNPEIDGVATGTEYSNPLSTSDPNSGRLYFTEKSTYVDPDPGHSIQDIYEQIFGVQWTQDVPSKQLNPAMRGFAQNAERKQKGMSETVVNGFNPDAVPVYKELVSEFALSVEGLPQKTIFESLDDASLSFGIYYQYPPSTLFYRNLRKLEYLKNFHPFDLTFKRHCKEGKLPNYVVIEQRYFDLKILPGNDDHPSHDVFESQKFVKQVYEVPSPDDLIGPEPYKFQFDRLGVRVPAILISPWIEKGTVLHGPSGPYPTSQFEYSSIPATVKKIFNLKEFLTKRDAWAGTFESLINRENPRTDCPEILPEPVRLRDTEAKEDAKLTDFQKELVQMTAVLGGDHKKDIYPHKLVGGRTVATAVDYANTSFEKFLDECERLKQNGADEFTICSLPLPVAEHSKKQPNSRSFISKFFSCVACNNS